MEIGRPIRRREITPQPREEPIPQPKRAVPKHEPVQPRVTPKPEKVPA